MEPNEPRRCAEFTPIALCSADDAPPQRDADDRQRKRVMQLAQEFERRFRHRPSAIVRAPGRVNLIGEHVDYEGYAVLPMAIEQDIAIAFHARRATTEKEPPCLTVANMNAAKFESVTILFPSAPNVEPAVASQSISQATSWSNYVRCGLLGMLTHRSSLQAIGAQMHVAMLIDGAIPAGCGLSSSSALVVASALAVAYAFDPSNVPSRLELAEVCRTAEQYIGTMGGGMDQAVSCLAQRGSAQHISFSPLRVTPVQLPTERLELTFVVANSMVVAEKAVDATTRFNKRVVECALAARMIAKGEGVADWKQISKLVEVQHALERKNGAAVDSSALHDLVHTHCPRKEYRPEDLETCFGTTLQSLFEDSPAALKVLTAASTFQLKQRALHVWAETNRVAQFRELCDAYESLAVKSENLAARLGELMLESHRSCQQLYECSCPELDALVDCAMRAGAFGARLTGAGWGGCIVALVAKSSVQRFTEQLQRDYYTKHKHTFRDGETVFESAPSSGADIYVLS